MFKNNFISDTEHKISLLVTLIAFAILLTNFAFLTIQNVNEEIKRVEARRIAKANGEQSEEFGFTTTSCFYSFESIAFGQSRFINFLFLPLSLLLLRKRKSSYFSLSTLLVFLSFFHFFFWFMRTQERRIFLESLSTPEPMTGFDNILLNSNVFDALLFLVISILFVRQMMILVCSDWHFLFRNRILP